MRTFGRRVPSLLAEANVKEERGEAQRDEWVDGCSRKENYKSFDETSHVRKRGSSLSIGEGWLVAVVHRLAKSNYP